eukprot:gene5976-7445_t
MFVGSVKLPLNNEIELISEEIQKGLDDTTVIKKFLEKRVQIEEEYAKNLQKLCKSQPNLNKLGGISGAFTMIVENINQYSNHLLQVVQKINDDINVPLKTFIKDLKLEQKTYITDGQNLAKERKSIFDSLRNAKSNYDSLYKDPESEPEKLVQAEEEYKHQIVIANRYHTSFHNDKLPKIQNDFQRLETIRMQKMKTNLKKFIAECESVPVKQSQCLKSSEDSINSIDTKRDIMAFVNFNKSLNQPTAEFLFEACEKEKKKKIWRSTMSVLKIPGISSGTSNSSNHGVSVPSNYLPAGKEQSQHPNAVFNVSIPEVMEKQKLKYQGLDVPYILVLLVNLIKNQDGMKTEGIFRVPGNNNDISLLKKQINEGDYNLPPEMTSIHTLASLLKLWLREMPSPLITDRLYDSAIQCEKTSDLLITFKQLPPHNQKIVTYIVQFLQDLIHPENVVHSKMNLDNTAMVFAPSFLRCTNPELLLSNIESEKDFIKLLIESYDELHEICQLNLGDWESKIKLNQQPNTTTTTTTQPPSLSPRVNSTPVSSTTTSSSSSQWYTSTSSSLSSSNGISAPITPLPSKKSDSFKSTSSLASPSSSSTTLSTSSSSINATGGGSSTTVSTSSPSSPSSPNQVYKLPSPPTTILPSQQLQNFQQQQQQQNSNSNSPNLIKKSTIKPVLPPHNSLANHINIYPMNGGSLSTSSLPSSMSSSGGSLNSSSVPAVLSHSNSLTTLQTLQQHNQNESPTGKSVQSNRPPIPSFISPDSTTIGETKPEISSKSFLTRLPPPPSK